MAIDQNSVPKDLRQLNIAQNIAEEPLVLPVSSTGRTVECYPPNSFPDIGCPGSVPLFYPAPVSDASIVGIGYGNGVSRAAAQCSPPGVPIAHPAIIPAAGFNYGPNFGLGGNAPGHGFMVTGPGYAPNLGNLVGGNGVDKAVSDAANGIIYGASQGNRIIGNASDQAGSIPSSWSSYSPISGHKTASSGVYQASEEGDDSSSGRKVKFLCSYGGKILPRPSDGMLRYVGGVTRIISFKRDVSFNELAQKMADAYGQPVVIKYQLPDEDLDALVSVSCSDDLENMMDEYGRLMEGSADGSSKLRVFLFSASEVDSSNVIQPVDVNDSGEKYVDAVNGISDGIRGGIVKESITSETSTQNSDFCGSEALGNYSMPGQGDISGALSSCMLSPKENVANSNDTVAKLVGTDPGPAIYSDAFAIPLGLPVPNSAPTQTSPFQNEVELDRSVPPTLPQQQYLLQQSMINIPPAAPYLQPFVDPHQEVMNHSDYVQQPPQMGFLNHPFLGRAGPVFTPQQLYGKSPGFPSHQVIPSVQLTMAPTVSHVGTRPNVIQTLMLPQKNLMDQYNYENTSGPSIMQVPIPSTVVGGNYGWVQVPPQEHAISADGLSPHQQVMIPDKILKLEECYLCQKTLPHAHSEPMVPDQPDGDAGSVSDSIPSYHSLPMEDMLKSQATNQVRGTAPLNEGIIEQGVDIRSKVISKVEPLVGVPSIDTTGLPHNYEPQHEGERTFTQKSDGFSHPANTVVQEVIGRAGDKQPKLPVENWIEQDVLINKPVTNDMSPVSTTALETSECMVQESPEYINELACHVSKADAVDNWIISNHLRATDGRINTLGVYNPENYVDNDHCKLPVDKPNGNDILDHKTQLPVEKEMPLDNNFGKSNMVLDSNQIKMTDMLPCSYTEISYGHNSRPVDCNEMAQPPFWSIPESNPQLKSGHHHKDDTVPSSLSPSDRCGEGHDSSNSLFSNQDPWNIHHDSYHPPPSPRPNKVALKKETYSSKDHFGENPSVNYDKQSLDAQLEGSLYQPSKQNLSLEHGQSARISKMLNHSSKHGLTEDPIRQELQAVAEGVAASVLLSSIPSNPDLHTGDKPGEEDIEEGNFKDKAQDVKTKLPENPNLGFPISDGLGRLQVIKNCDLEELRELGSGTFGTVYHGKWRGSDVAIKRINDRCFAGKPSEQERMRADFWNEAIKLADLHHPNVLAFYGVVLDGPGGTVATVTEYMVNGSLRNALQKNERNLDKRKRLLIAMDVAFGMEYLHAKNIVHFDLKSDNLLVNLRDHHRPICKVGDLGLSKAKCQTLISGGVRGTLPWMAPELLNGSSSLVSEKVDVFSFGIVMWELLTGEEPYADLFYGAIIGGIVSNTLRPKVPESCNPEWRWLMERCWSSEPSERPSFTEITDELRLMAAKSPRKGQNQQQPSPSLQPDVQK